MGEVKINEIKLTKKGRYALFCQQDGFLFSVDEETLIRHHIKEGTILSGEELERVRAASDYQRARNKALDLLGSREHSEMELYRKLCRSFDEDTSALVVARMRELELVNDQRFAKQYVQELVEHRGASRTAVRAKLAEKGVSRELIAEVLEEIEIDDTDALRALIEKKYRSKLNTEKGRQQTIASLARRGFLLRDIRNALNVYFEEQSFEQDREEEWTESI